MDNEQTYREFYTEFVKKRITDLRLAKGVSEREMSLALGKGSNFVNQIASGSIMPLLANFFDICEYLGVTPAEFFITPNDPSAVISKISSDLSRFDTASLHEFYKFESSLSAEQFKIIMESLKQYRGSSAEKYDKS